MEKKKVSKKQQACVRRYIENHYDRINVQVKKGKKERIQSHAQGMGESTNAFINRAIDEAMERDQTESMDAMEEKEKRF